MYISLGNYHKVGHISKPRQKLRQEDRPRREEQQLQVKCKVPAGAGSLAIEDWLGSLRNLTFLEVRADVESWPANMTALSKLERLMVSIHSHKNTVIVGILKHRYNLLDLALESVLNACKRLCRALSMIHIATHCSSFGFMLLSISCGFSLSIWSVPWTFHSQLYQARLVRQSVDKALGHRPSHKNWRNSALLIMNDRQSLLCGDCMPHPKPGKHYHFFKRTMETSIRWRYMQLQLVLRRIFPTAYKVLMHCIRSTSPVQRFQCNSQVWPVLQVSSYTGLTVPQRMRR